MALAGDFDRTSAVLERDDVRRGRAPDFADKLEDSDEDYAAGEYSDREASQLEEAAGKRFDEQKAAEAAKSVIDEGNL